MKREKENRPFQASRLKTTNEKQRQRTKSRNRKPPMKNNQWKITNEKQPMKNNQWKTTNEKQPMKNNQWNTKRNRKKRRTIGVLTCDFYTLMPRVSSPRLFLLIFVCYFQFKKRLYKKTIQKTRRFGRKKRLCKNKLHEKETLSRAQKANSKYLGDRYSG